MANGDNDAVFGGNGSVSWALDIGAVRTAKYETKPDGRYLRHLQSGINEAQKGSRFTIVIKLPRNPKEKDAFRSALRAAADKSDGSVELTLPIEDERRDQIRISWKSEPRKGEREPTHG